MALEEKIPSALSDASRLAPQEVFHSANKGVVKVKFSIFEFLFKKKLFLKCINQFREKLRSLQKKRKDLEPKRKLVRKQRKRERRRQRNL